MYLDRLPSDVVNDLGVIIIYRVIACVCRLCYQCVVELYCSISIPQHVPDLQPVVITAVALCVKLSVKTATVRLSGFDEFNQDIKLG